MQTTEVVSETEVLEEKPGYKQAIDLNSAPLEQIPTLMGILGVDIKMAQTVFTQELELLPEEKKVFKMYSDLEKWIKKFNNVHGDIFGTRSKRDIYIWNWVFSTLGIVNIAPIDSISDKKIAIQLQKTQFLGVLWDVLCDDIADDLLPEQAKKMLPLCLSKEEYSNSDRTGLSQEEIQYIDLCHQVYDEVWKQASNFPGFERHRSSLMKEYDKLREVMKYSLEIRAEVQEGNYSVIDYEKYVNILSNNMHMMINWVLALMAFDHPSTLDSPENESMEELVWYSQRCGRIGNSATTAEKEVPRGDYTSEAVALALMRGYINVEDFDKAQGLDTGLPLAITDLWQEWEEIFKKIITIYREHSNNGLSGLDVEKYIRSIAKLRLLHIASTGKK